MGGYAVRDIQADDVRSVVTVHLRAMPDFFLSSLGSGFLRTYYASVIVDQTAIAAVAVDETSGDIAGFVVGSRNPAGFYGRLLRERWLHFAVASIPALLRNPAAALRIARATRYPSSQPEGEGVGGLYSIAVLPEVQGLGVGRLLVDRFLLEARAGGLSAVYLHADAEGNDGWNALLVKTGWQLRKTFSTPEGRSMNEYWYTL